MDSKLWVQEKDLKSTSILEYNKGRWEINFNTHMYAHTYTNTLTNPHYTYLQKTNSKVKVKQIIKWNVLTD